MNYRKVRSILVKNGWKCVRKEGSHEQYKKAGHPNLVTLVKHAGRDLSKGVLSDIEKDSGLSLRR